MLHDKLTAGETAVIRQPPEALYGLGGVGKTEIAAEYAHRHSSEYDVVWWIRADQEDSIRAALIGLGRQLGLKDFHPEERDYSSRLVLDALRAGDPYEHWLLIFDNVTRPGIIGRYIPQGSGHVIITSRLSEWQRELRTDGIEITEFALGETVQLLRSRIPRLAYQPDAAAAGSGTPQQEDARRQAEAERLARTLGNLPLAAEHAAAYLTETGYPVSEYIDAFDRNAHELFSRDADMFASHVTVATTWSLTRDTLTPEARALFQVLAFFSAEPISEEVLVQPGRMQDLAPELAVLCSNAECRRAGRELARFSLAKINGVRNVIQVHNVAQAVTRGRIEREDPAAAVAFRDTVHALLAASDPGAPEKEQNDPVYERSVHHLVPSEAQQSANPLVRNLIINQVRRLHLRGGFAESLSLGEPTLRIWREKFGADDVQTLALAVEIGIALRSTGRVAQAHELNSDTLRRLSGGHGEDDEVYLLCANSYGADLRLLGRYDDALAHDLRLLPAYERVFGPSQYRVLSLRNNIAIDLRCVGRFDEALDYDQSTYAERERLFGWSDRLTLWSKYGISRDLRRLGRYDEALNLVREVANVLERRNEPWRLYRLGISVGLAAALRRVGLYQEGWELAEENLQRYQALVGEEHREALVAATNLINDRRVVDDLDGAQELGEHTVMSWDKIVGAGHPNTLAARTNLAVVLRMRGNLDAARETNESVLAGFRHLYAYDHPSTLVVMTNLASDLAAIGDVRRAREIGEQAMTASQQTRGHDHPATLAIAANLALDLRATGDDDRARELHAQTMAGYEAQLTQEHPQGRRAAQQGRVNVDLEPMSS